MPSGPAQASRWGQDGSVGPGGGALGSLQLLPSRQSSDLCPQGSPTIPQTSPSLCCPGAAPAAARAVRQSGSCSPESGLEAASAPPTALLSPPPTGLAAAEPCGRAGGQETRRVPGAALWARPQLIINQAELLTSSSQRRPSRPEPMGNGAVGGAGGPCREGTEARTRAAGSLG